MILFDQAFTDGEHVTASKRGLEKCFDKEAVRQAIDVLRRLGIDRGVANVCEFFRDNHFRWVEYKGACASEPLKSVWCIL